MHKYAVVSKNVMPFFYTLQKVQSKIAQIQDTLVTPD